MHLNIYIYIYILSIFVHMHGVTSLLLLNLKQDIVITWLKNC